MLLNMLYLLKPVRDSLQYLTFGDERRNQYYIVTGSVSVTSFVKNPNLPGFGIQQRGFSAVHYYKKGIWIEFWNENGYLNERYLIWPKKND